MPGNNCVRGITFAAYAESVFARHDLNKSEKYVLLYIALRFINGGYEPIRIGVSRFCMDLNMTPGGYIRHVHELVQRGFVMSQDCETGHGFAKAFAILPLPPEQGA